MQHPGAARAPRAAPVHALQAQAAHESLHALPGASDTVRLPQFGVDPGAAVGAAAALVRLLDQLAEASILESSLRRFPVGPGVEATPGDLQDAAHDAHGVVGLLAIYEPEDYLRPLVSSAKKTAAFFKISRSSRKTLFSRRRRLSSALASLSSPGRAPLAMSERFTHSRSELLLTPNSSAICCSGLPLSRNNRTASTLNSRG